MTGLATIMTYHGERTVLPRMLIHRATKRADRMRTVTGIMADFLAGVTCFTQIGVGNECIVRVEIGGVLIGRGIEVPRGTLFCQTVYEYGEEEYCVGPVLIAKSGLCPSLITCHPQVPTISGHRGE